MSIRVPEGQACLQKLGAMAQSARAELKRLSVHSHTEGFWVLLFSDTLPQIPRGKISLEMAPWPSWPQSLAAECLPSMFKALGSEGYGKYRVVLSGSQRQGRGLRTTVAGVGTFGTYGRQLVKAGKELVE